MDFCSAYGNAKSVMRCIEQASDFERMGIQEPHEQNFFKLRAVNSQCALIGTVVAIGEIATYKMKLVAFNMGDRLMIAITIKYIRIQL